MRDQPLPAREAARYVSEAALAVHHAHQQGTLHRDLKPSNILIDRHDRVRITDFGLAKRIEDNSELTLTGQILGTPSYMPPEQALGKRSLIGAASDVYSLGAVLYELLAGRPPFRGESPAATLRQVETLEPVSPRLLNPATPRDLETICLKCLEKEPHKRYGTAQLMSDDLARFLRGEPILARPISSTARVWRWCKRKPAVATAGLAVVVALASLVGGGWVLLDSARVGAAYRRAEEARLHAVGLSGQLQKALGETEEARDKQASLRREKEAALTKLESAYGLLAGQRAATQSALEESEQLRYQLQIVAADRAMHSHEISYARELLQACPESLRSWEWHFMQHLTAYELQVCRSLPSPLRSAALAPDEASFYGVATSGRLTHWDLAANASRPLPENLATLVDLTCLAVHAPTNQLALGNRHGQLQIVSLTTGKTLVDKQLGSFQQQPALHGLTALTFRDDGAYLAAVTVSSAHVLATQGDRIWSVDKSRIRSIALHPTQSIAILGLGDERNPESEQVPRGRWLAVWHYDEADKVELPVPESTAVTALDFNAGGSVLAAGMADGKIECWRLDDTWTKDWELSGHDAAVRDLQFGEAGQQLASASDDQTVRLWKIGAQEPLAIFRQHLAAVTALDLAPDNKSLLSVGGRVAALWDTSTRASSLTLATGTGQQSDRLITIDVRPDGRQIAAAGLRGMLYLFDAEKVGELDARRGSGRHSIAYGSETGQLILGAVPPVVLDLERGEKTGKGLSSQSRISLTPDRTRAAIGTDKGATVYRLPDMSIEHEIVIEAGSVVDVAFLADGMRLATASNASRHRSSPSAKPVVAIWDLATGLKIHTLEGCTQTVWDIDASPDQRFLAAATGNGMNAEPGQVKVWDVQSGELVFDLSGHQLPVWSVAFSPDSRRLASGAGVWTNRNMKGNAELKVWDLQMGRLLLDLDGHEWTVMDLVFSPDGRRLYSASEDGSIRVWPGIPGVEKRTDVVRRVETSSVAGPEPSHYQRGVALAGQKAWDEAIAAYREAIRLNPNFADAHYRLAAALRRTGQFAEAAAAYEEGFRLRLGSAEECNNFAWLLVSCPQPEVRNPKRAVEVATKATELAPGNLAYWNSLGVAFYRSGDWTSALVALEKSKDLDLKSFAFGHNALFMAMSYWQLGNQEKARHWYEQGLDYQKRNRDLLAKDDRGEEIERFLAEAAELLGIQAEK
jgi:WD40 repeat protein/Tfp pilus assembly protein PilF